MGEVEKCWRAQAQAQVKEYLVVEAVCGGSVVSLAFVSSGERKGGGGGEKKKIYISDISESRRREVSRGTAHEVVAHELRSRRYQY